MKLYNTLNRHVDNFKPIKPPEVKLYTCGPTVYDNQTIGNLRTYVFYDTLKRALMANSYEVKHVMNITDVGHLTSDADEGEDKLEKSATLAGKTVWQVAEHYIQTFEADLKRLNILEPEIHRATNLVDQQIDMVKLLLDKGFAYQTKQAIYFDVGQLSDYGKLTGQKLAEKEVAVRQEVVTDKNKRSPQDFAVWFFTVGRFAGHEMKWPSPWGNGFPGWHLECSAIIHQTLGDPIDIHAGAVDLIGTHHTNEMAQTEAAFGHNLANYWVHGEHLLVNGQRMAKSLKNFYTLDDVMKRGYDPLSLRLLYLQSHYHSQMNFTWQSLEAAQTALKNFQAWADLVHQPKALPQIDAKQLLRLESEIIAALNQDLNSARALAGLNDFIDKIRPTPEFLRDLDNFFGLGLAKRIDIDQSQNKLIAKREAARQKKDWLAADRIRQQLKAQGLEINDTGSGPIWSRV